MALPVSPSSPPPDARRTGRTPRPPAGPSAELRLPLAAIGARIEPAERCPACGFTGLSPHYRGSRSVRDFSRTEVQTLAVQCRRCRHVHRRYPSGIGPGGQSFAVGQVTAFLRCAGFSYARISAILAGLGCRLSASGVRKHLGWRSASRRSFPRGGAGRRRAGDLGFELQQHGRRRWLSIQYDPHDAELTARLLECRPAVVDAAT